VALSQDADLYIRCPVIAAHPAMAECAVIARADDLRGQEPMGLVVPKSGMTITAAELQQQLISRISKTNGKLFDAEPTPSVLN
jgi:acyl-coenzyme A synthetase/AMP-(fatty) acid ligase